MRISRARDELTCRRALEMVTDYLEETLPANRRHSLEHHLALCPHCAEYLTQIQAIIAASRHVEPEQLGPEVRATLIELYRRTR